MRERVLLAVSAEAKPRLEAVLAGHELTHAESFAAVRVALAKQTFDLIVVGTHFEESSAFDVLRHIKESESQAHIACVRGVPFHAALGKPAMDAFRAACEALGVNVVLDLFDYPDDEAGNRRARTLLEQQMHDA